jgi:predicted glycoside hydrolase/deacetylase ChbG (UPF0249 family)
MSRRLIVNADDYGLTRGVSHGIREAHLRGIVTSTTAMMNMPGVDDDLRLAMEETPRLGLGVHLVLTASRPALPPGQVPDLVSADGRFLPLDEFAAARSLIELEQVRREWRAQIEKFIAITGNTPDHLDSHHHTSFFSEGLFRSMLELALDYGCAVRSPLRALEGTGMPAEVEAEFGGFAPTLLAEFSPRTTDVFCASFYDEGVTFPNLLSILDRLPAGTAELMCHPAYADDALAAISSYIGPRQSELALLTDPALAFAITEHGIALRNFGEIQ